MIRAFIDVFPQSVLLSGRAGQSPAHRHSRRPISSSTHTDRGRAHDPPRGSDDLVRLDLGSVREIAGAFVGSARTLTEATNGGVPSPTIWPSTEYSVLSALNPGEDVPANVVTSIGCRVVPDLLFEWQARPGGRRTGSHMRIMQLSVRSVTSGRCQADRARERGRAALAVVAGSAYLGAIVPGERRPLQRYRCRQRV